MKRILLILIFLSLIPQMALAHPGRLDKNGGHRKTADGTYHYHLESDRTIEFETPPPPDYVLPTPTPKPNKTP